MTRSRFFALALSTAMALPILTLSSLGSPSVARADRAVQRGGSLGFRVPSQRAGAMARRVRPVPTPAGPPPIRQVRSELRQLGPAIQACALRYEPPGRGRSRRLRVRVWLYPNGRWTMEVPELAARRRQPAPSYAALRSCMQSAVSIRIQQHVHPFRGRTRQKVERAYRVRMPGPPPSEAALSRRVTRQRRRIVACVPGAGRQGGRAEITVRATLGVDGSLTVTGLGLPEGVPFEAVSRCVTQALATVTLDPVTTPRSFETTVRFRYRAPSPAPRPQQPI